MRPLLYIIITTILFTISCQSGPERTNYDEAMLSLQQGKQEDAIRFLLADLQENPQSYRTHLKLAECYQTTDQHDKAIRVLDNARMLEPENPEAWLLSAETYAKMGQTATDEESRNNVYLQGQHQFSKVLEFTQLTEEQKFRASLGKGKCLLRRLLIEDSEPHIKTALSLKPDDEEALYYSALLKQAQLGPNKTSLQLYEKALAHNPEHLPTLQELTGTYCLLGYNQKALERGQQYLAAGGKDESIVAWVAQKTKSNNPPPTPSATVTPSDTTASATQDSTTATPTPPPTPAVVEIVMICPMCGRCGQAGQKTCSVDATELIPME